LLWSANHPFRLRPPSVQHFNGWSRNPDDETNSTQRPTSISHPKDGEQHQDNDVVRHYESDNEDRSNEDFQSNEDRDQGQDEAEAEAEEGSRDNKDETAPEVLRAIWQPNNLVQVRSECMHPDLASSNNPPAYLVIAAIPQHDIVLLQLAGNVCSRRASYQIWRHSDDLEPYSLDLLPDGERERPR
jgi:hypothetical protein